MDTIKIYIDTDVLSKFALMNSPHEVVSLMKEQGLQLVISDSTIQEILCTRDISRRKLICQFIIELLQDGPILAPVSQQIRWSSIDFVEGLSIFQPYRTGKEKWVKDLLANPDRVSEEDIDTLYKKRKNDDSVWNSMHDTGRKILQGFFSPTNKGPTICEWLSNMDGHLGWFPIKSIVAPEVCQMIAGCERKFVEWNPLLRCYIEQFLLAIYRYGIEPRNVSSKKGPKWMDYFHGAFAGLVDVFVTNDKRFLAALKQHQQLRPEWRCLIHDQNELKQFLDSTKDFKNTFVHKAVITAQPREE